MDLARHDSDAHTLAPITKRLTVPLTPAAAFELFTDGVGTWWPTATHSVGGDRVVACVLERGLGGRFFERTDDGTEHVWGEVTAWEPPGLVRFTWHPGRDASTGQEVDVTFEPDGDGATTVTLVHTGWERLGDLADAQHSNYLTGWDLVLGDFGTAAAAAAAA